MLLSLTASLFHSSPTVPLYSDSLLAGHPSGEVGLLAGHPSGYVGLLAGHHSGVFGLLAGHGSGEVGLLVGRNVLPEKAK